MTTVAAAPPFDVASNFGPFYFAVALDTMFYGVVLCLSALYITTSRNDRWWMRGLVCSVLAVETLHTAFNLSSAYKPLVIGFGDYSNLLYSPWEAQTDPLTTGIVAALVQCFFAWRVKVLTRQHWIVAIILLFSFVQLLGAIGTTIAAHRVPFIPDFPKFQSIVIVWCTGAVGADLLITGTLVFHLRRKKTGMEFTDNLINKITLMTIETGLLTFIWVITDLIVFLTVPTPISIHLVFNLSISKMYSLSLLVSLNSRNLWASSLASQIRSRSESQGQLSHGQLSRGIGPRRGEGSDTKVAQQIYIGVESHEMVHVDELKAAR